MRRTSSADRAAVRAARREVAGRRRRDAVPAADVREMIERFGSDKPDLRYGMELVDLAESSRATGFNAFASVLASGGRIKAIAAPGGGSASRKELDDLVDRDEGARRGGPRVDGRRGRAGSARPVEKILSPEEIAGLAGGDGRASGDLMLIVADRADRVAVALDGAPPHAWPRGSGLIREGEWAYLWMTEPPLFEWSDEDDNVGLACTTRSPRRSTRRSRARDGEGARLRHRAQRVRARRRQHPHPSSRPAAKVFECWASTPEEIEEKFGHLLDRVPIRRASSRRDRAGHRPSGDGDGRQGCDPRRDRVPQGAIGRRSADRCARRRSMRCSCANWA